MKLFCRAWHQPHLLYNPRDTIIATSVIKLDWGGLNRLAYFRSLVNAPFPVPPVHGVSDNSRYLTWQATKRTNDTNLAVVCHPSETMLDQEVRLRS